MGSKKNYINLKINTNHTTINDMKFGDQFFDTWFQAREELRPEIFASTETSKRYNITDEGLESIRQKWIEKCQFFKRKSKPSYSGIIFWDTHYEILIARGKNYPVGLSISLSMSTKEIYMIDLFKLFLPIFYSKYGSIDSRYSIDKKYYFKEENDEYDNYRSRGAYVGTHFPQLGMTIPQITWVNYFGDELVSLIGEDKFLSLKAYQIEKIANGYFIMSYPSHKMIDTPEANAEEERIMQHLGREYFFDRNKVNAEEWIWKNY